MLSEIFEFSFAVLSKWQAYVTGGLIIALIFVWERITKKQVALKYVILLVVGSLLVSFFLAWHDQRTLVSERDKSLSEVNARLANRTTGLMDHINVPHRLDPAIENLGSIQGAFAALQRTMGVNKCDVLMTEPRDSTNSVFDALVLGAGMAGCPSGGTGGVNNNPASETNMVKGEDPNAVVIHAPEGTPGILTLEGALGSIFNVHRSNEPLPGLRPGIIWFQVGRNVRWNRQITEPELDGYLRR